MSKDHLIVFSGIAIIVAFMFCLTDSALKDLQLNSKREAKLFTDMDNARDFQRQCLANGGDALVREEITGITIICTGAK